MIFAKMRHAKKIHNTLTNTQTIDSVDDLEIDYTPLHWASECNISSLCMTEIPAGVASSEFQLYNTESAFSCDRHRHHLSDLLDFIECQTGIFHVSKATRHRHFAAEINCILFRPLKQRGAFSGLCKDVRPDKTITTPI